MTTSPSEVAALATVDVTASGTFTYTIDPLAEVVRVNIELDVQALQYPRPAGDDCPYFTFPIPATLSIPVENQVVAPGTRGRTVRGSVGRTAYTNIEERPGWATAKTPAECDTYRRQVAHQSISYSFYGGPPRSVFEVRTSAAFFLFPIELFGDPGKINVVVAAPSDYVIEGLGDEWIRSSENGVTTFTQLGVADPEGFTAVVSARNDSLLRRSELTTADESDFLLQYWTGDEQWTSLAGAQIETALPVLADAVGQPWPFVTPVDVQELPVAALQPGNAWTYASKQLFQIGEDVDQVATVRQLSHAWFNDTWFSERWMADGFATVYANMALASLGNPPAALTAADSTSPGAFPLSSWVTPASGQADESGDRTEQYGSQAAAWVVQQLLEEIGPEAMSEVLAAVASGATAYTGDGTTEAWSETTDWRHMLDLLEDVGGSTRAADLFREFVAPANEVDAMAMRDEARRAYRELIDAGNGWAPPAVVRQLLHEWSFEEAMKEIAVASEILALRDSLETATIAAGHPAPASLELMYEAGTQLADVQSSMEEYLEVAELLQRAVEARDGDHGLLGGIGLLGTDLAIPVDEAAEAFRAGDLETSRRRAKEVIDEADSATLSGILRVGILAAIGGGITALVRRPRRRARGTSSSESIAAPPGAGRIDGEPEAPAPAPSMPPDTNAEPGATVDP